MIKYNQIITKELIPQHNPDDKWAYPWK